MQQNNKEELWHESLPGIIRENLIWYKENGTDHGDLVVAEEAILDKVKQTLSKREAEIREKIEKYRTTLEHFAVVSDGEMPRIWKAKADTCTEILPLLQPKDNK